jgi:hypothetical protein
MQCFCDLTKLKKADGQVLREAIANKTMGVSMSMLRGHHVRSLPFT